MGQPLTHQMIAREAAAMLEAACPFVSNINRDREEEFGRDVSGYTLGDTVKVKIQPFSQVFDGPVFAGGAAAPAQNETYVNLTVDTQKHIPIQFGAKEKKLDLADFKERFLRPAMATLGAWVDADLLGRAYKTVPKVVGTAGTLPSSFRNLGDCKASLDRSLAPVANRYGCLSSDTNASLTDKTITLFNPAGTISKQWKDGIIGDNNGIEWYIDQGLPVHTNGTVVAGLTVSGASQSGSSLTIGGLTAGQTIKAGSSFTIANVFEVHPLIGTVYPQLRQFVVTADFTAAGTTGAISIYPAINMDTTLGQVTVNALPATGAALSFYGSASTAYRQDIIFHRDAFAGAFVPLPILASCVGYTAALKGGPAVRVMTFGDGYNDIEKTRIDVLYAFATVRGDHAVRLTE